MFVRCAVALRPAAAASCDAWRRRRLRFPPRARVFWTSSRRDRRCACAAGSLANLRETRRLLPAKGEDQLDQSDRQRDVAECHDDLVRGMPVQPCKFIETVEEIQDQEDHPEQLDAAANQAMTQIAEQNDRRLVARDMRARRDDQRPDDHFFNVTEYFLGSLLDMLGVERKPSGSDIHGFSLMAAAGIGRIGSGRMGQTAIFRFSIPAFSIPGVSIHWPRYEAARKPIT